MKARSLFCLAFSSLLFGIGFSSCFHDINCLPDTHFTDEGIAKDSIVPSLNLINPSKVKIFMEASGSMNGLYRPNCTSEFRDDVYQIASYYLRDTEKVYTLCSNNGKSGYEYDLNNFAKAIKMQGFPQMGATSITDMIETVISNVDTLRNEVGILISDMKFDPDGKNNIDYQLGMYTTKVSHITSESHFALSMVAAKSKYYDAKNNVISNDSPYYYVILGKSENVAKVRNDISSMLEANGTYIENIETGMNYGGPRFEVNKVRNCMKLKDQPTFLDVDLNTPCKICLTIGLENYRWYIADSQKVIESFNCQMLHGGKVSVDSIDIQISNKDAEFGLNRKVDANIFLNISNLQTDCDVLEWSFNPCSVDTSVGNLIKFFGAYDWKEFDKTYSLENFLQGLFRGAHLSSCNKKTNYVLISKHN